MPYCVPPPINRLRQSIKWLIWLTLGSSITCAFLSLVIWHAMGGQVLRVQTGSMAPSFNPGDAVVVHPAKLADLRIGQVVSYRSAINPKLIISHRVIHINRLQASFTTQGDRLPKPDPLVSQSQLVGQVTAVLPRLGLLIAMIHRPVGLTLLVYFPLGSIVLEETVRLTKAYNHPHYRLYGYS